jgi:hypothetical protein
MLASAESVTSSLYCSCDVRISYCTLGGGQGDQVHTHIDNTRGSVVSFLACCCRQLLHGTLRSQRPVQVTVVTRRVAHCILDAVLLHTCSAPDTPIMQLGDN